jgi:hypothetical protein
MSPRIDDDASSLPDAGNAIDYRRWADNCAKQAADPRVSGDERAYLLAKRSSLIALAATDDWLNGEIRPHATH